MGMFSAPIEDLVARLTWQTADIDGRILRGFRWVPIPIGEAEGLADLPGIRLFMPDFRENFRPRALLTGQIGIKLLVATSREKGIVEFTQSLEKVVDALQLKPDNSGESASLEGSAKPFEWLATDNFVTATSLNANVVLMIEPKPRGFAERRL